MKLRKHNQNVFCVVNLSTGEAIPYKTRDVALAVAAIRNKNSLDDFYVTKVPNAKVAREEWEAEQDWCRNYLCRSKAV